MQIIEKDIKDIKPYERNPRQNDKAVPYVAESIKEFGFKVPIVIDKDGVIVAGHTRYKASKQLGLEKVPCIVADDLTDEQIKAFRLADNKVAEQADWDIELLDFELDEIVDINMSYFGFDILDDDVPEKEQKDLSDKVADTYEVIIECADEFHQEELYTRLSEEGLNCRVLTL